MPQSAAGIRIDPPPSLPSAIGAMPAATAAADPALEPPEVWSSAQGLRVVSHRCLDDTTGDISREDGGQPTFDASLDHDGSKNISFSSASCHNITLQ
jgi:hypothetical protein